VSLGDYLILHLSFIGKVRPAPPLWLVCLYITVGPSRMRSPTLTRSSCVKNFPESRGVILGL
jgi:hypothetical protein